MLKLLAMCILLLTGSSTIAQPEQIDVLGLIPNKSTADDIRGVSSGAIDNRLFFLEIGGYKLPCLPQFDKDKLSSLSCVTSEKYSNASNMEIHSNLVKGFTKKFGPPISSFINPVRTPLGVEYKAEELWWIDAVGNSLILYSMQGRIDQGALLLLSSEKSRELKEVAEKKDSQRRF